MDFSFNLDTFKQKIQKIANGELIASMIGQNIVELLQHHIFEDWKSAPIWREVGKNLIMMQTKNIMTFLLTEMFFDELCKDFHELLTIGKVSKLPVLMSRNS